MLRERLKSAGIGKQGGKTAPRITILACLRNDEIKKACAIKQQALVWICAGWDWLFRSNSMKYLQATGKKHYPISLSNSKALSHNFHLYRHRFI